VQTQEGVFAGDGALEALVRKGRAAAARDLAFGKQAVASSVSDFKGGVSGNIRETFPALSGFYAARYAVDHNNGTRWAPTTLRQASSSISAQTLQWAGARRHSSMFVAPTATESST
jgi:hypothetical protein